MIIHANQKLTQNNVMGHYNRLTKSKLNLVEYEPSTQQCIFKCSIFQTAFKQQQIKVRRAHEIFKKKKEENTTIHLCEDQQSKSKHV